MMPIWAGILIGVLSLVAGALIAVLENERWRGP